jgi:hypothetical protein
VYASVHVSGTLGMELKRLVPHHLLKYLLRRLKVVPAPVERFLAFRLYLFVVQTLEVWMLQALLHRIALFWVKDQHFAE